MSWARLDDQVAFHPKILRAGNDAFGAWVRMLAHSCAQLTDGLIERDVATTITSKQTLDRLVRARLLDADGEDYRIHDFHDWNPPASEVRARREAEKSRKSSGRKSQGRSSDGRLMSARNPHGKPPDVQPESARTSTGPVPVPIPEERSPPGSPPDATTPDVPPNAPSEPSPPPVSGPRRAVNGAQDGAAGFAVGAWRMGIESVTGAPYAIPSPGEQAKLATALVAHRPEGVDACDFARSAAAEFARRQVDAGAVINPFAFADWLNSGKPAAARQRSQRRPDGVQTAEGRAWSLPEES